MHSGALIVLVKVVFAGTCDSSAHGDKCEITNLEMSAVERCTAAYLTNLVAGHNGAYEYNVFQCLKASLFSSCSSHNDCESSYCLNNVCYAKSTGDTCTGNAECFSNNCSGTFCQASEDSCSSDSDCNGKTCVDNVCTDVSGSSCWNAVWDTENETDFNCGNECLPYQRKTSVPCWPIL